jgi:hypothetical protein
MKNKLSVVAVTVVMMASMVDARFAGRCVGNETRAETATIAKP